MQSISYHLVLLILKLKGVKSAFSTTPIHVQHLRREDMHQPSKKLLAGNTARSFTIGETTITEIRPKSTATDFLILYCPGGAYVYGPTELNWNLLTQLVKSSRTKAWLVDYPKAPEAKIEKIAANLDRVYAEALESYPPSKIILLGDSVGGSLIIALVQRLVQAGQTPPAGLIAISPVCDASLTNPEIEKLDRMDPILSKPGALSAKLMCAGTTSLKDPIISPLYGSFKNFPASYLFIAENDIMRPDEQLAIQRMQEAAVPLRVIEGKGMPHIWPLLPLMQEAKQAVSKIGEIIQETVQMEKQAVNPATT